MALLLNLLLFIIVFLVVLLVLFFLLVMVIPLSYRFRVCYQGEKVLGGSYLEQNPLYSFRVDYREGRSDTGVKIFFIPLPSITFSGKKVRIHKDKTEIEGEEKKEKKEKAFNSRMVKVFMNKEVVEHLLLLLKDLLKIIKPDRFEISGKVGFEEPHLVGWLWAFLWSLKGLFPGGVIDLESLWDEEYYDVRVMIAGKITPGVVFLRLLRFLLSKRTMKVARELRKLKKLEEATA
ncbi:MAG: hypothetical protein D5R97_00425 [Candidatus Syntrophonatronum acetioxidans]|uniref:DUF2953 domain-containing protein n=1 Tax=Candidatus Syntrophonatronum acetioxidans TaxID=1795816 RepID=A0A424YIT5_9FIRM|nr:MAG: hypothetical protein D5R97_00425 [Candidatus Syntrophonatronum acetioxidans]